MLLAYTALFFALFMAPPPAGAENAAIRDITMGCKFHLSEKAGREARLFDCDANTYWQSEKGKESYIQFYKPAGAATLSVLWAKIPGRLELRQRVAGKSVVLAVYEAQGDLQEAGAIPSAFLLPEAAGMYRLSTEDGMDIAELRVHAGVVTGFFTEHGYPSAPTRNETADSLMKPLQRGARISKRVKWMQQRLVELGYFDGKADGKFGEKTYLALLRFQRVNGLYPSGAYEPATVHMLEDPGAIAAPQVQTGATKPPRYSSAFINFLRDHVGAGYVYGGTGQISSPTVRGAAVRLYPEFSSLLRGYASRWDGLMVFDCSGLMKAFLEATGGASPAEKQVNVNGAVQRWAAEVGPIETMPRQPGLLLLQEDPDLPGSFIHMGAYVGEGQSVHARGHRYGVVIEPMPQLWTHWARPVWLEFDTLEEAEAPWPEYMGPGTRVMVDSADGGPIQLYSQPVKSKKYKTGISLENYTELLIEEIPEGHHYWRVTTVLDAAGQPVTGYVFARDLSLMK